VVKLATKRMLLKLRREFAQEKATLWVGRNGLTEDLVSEALRQLDEEELVKVRVQKSVMQSAADVAKVLAETLKAEVVDVRGRSFILYRHKGP
jgi:RNA-binding protein